MNRTHCIVIGVSVVICMVSALSLLPLDAQEPAKGAEATPARYHVSTEVLPGNFSMTLFYITDAKTNQLHIYQATGGLDTAFGADPKLYRTFDLTTVGQDRLKQAR